MRLLALLLLASSAGVKKRKADSMMAPHPELPAVWLAPMVDGSELAFRMLCRKHGATTAYTPMLRAEHVLNAPLPSPCPADRPLVVQLCGNNPSILGDAVAALAAHYGKHLDGVDLNLGCPQQASRSTSTLYTSVIFLMNCCYYTCCLQLKLVFWSSVKLFFALQLTAACPHLRNLHAYVRADC